MNLEDFQNWLEAEFDVTVDCVNDFGGILLVTEKAPGWFIEIGEAMDWDGVYWSVWNIETSVPHSDYSCGGWGVDDMPNTTIKTEPDTARLVSILESLTK